LYLANEGELVAIVAAGDADRVLAAMRARPAGAGTVVIGEVRERPAGIVIMQTGFGGERIVDMLVGDLSIANGIVEIYAARAGTARVTRVQLEIGQLSAMLPDAVRFCFDVCARDTVLDGAALEIVETRGRAVCRDCDGEVALVRLAGRCTCGSAKLCVVAGEELKIRELECA
jgi:hydrogenase nickel incorporation protein HypA/HybF